MVLTGEGFGRLGLDGSLGRQELRDRGPEIDHHRFFAVPGGEAPRQLYSPGDVVTLRAVFRAPTSREGDELLAARAIVYTAIAPQTGL